MSWLDGLNQISPDYSPTNGMHDPSFEYSAPIDALELQRQLDEWTNVPFAIDPPVLKRADFENDEYMRRNKTATAQHSSIDFNLGLDFSGVDAGVSPSSPTAAADRSTSSSGSDSLDIPSSVADSLHPLAFANVLALPRQREANRQARDARTNGLQSHASDIFSQPLAASFSMPMANTAADAGTSAGSDPFLSLLSLPTVSAPTAAPAALQQQERQLTDSPSHVTSVQAPLSRAQQQAAAKNRGRSSHQVTATPGVPTSSSGTAARRASTGVEALRENTSAKSGVGTDKAAVVGPKQAKEPVTEADDEELNRVAVEEDKRRRNTAASARFRIKKKQREQALEASASALRERVAELEKEVDTLKQENGWLRGLVVEKTNLGPSSSTADENVNKGRKRLREDDAEDDLVEA